VRDHADIESDCGSCHKRFDRDAQRSLCLDCHDEIAGDFDRKEGFHGISPDVGGQQCAACHSDHEGRGADIVGLVAATFDHTLTDFELLGLHSDAACVDCHEPAKTYRAAPEECVDCHLEDDVHDSQLGTACADCHNPNDWAEFEFDHETTEFPLVGMHQDAECAGCHEDQTHQNTPTDCFGCHAADDIHEGRSGEQCGNCHNEESWTDTSFDHFRDTDFDLLGGHADLSCDSCHSDDPFRDQLQMDCVSCHLDDDEHKGHNGTDCASCHSNDNWTEIGFDHSQQTDFDLNGAHQELACNDCHVEPIFESAPGATCESCHLEDDVHEGSQGGQCQDCHSETSWEDAPLFDHSLTRFPLLGEHDNIECDSCHLTQVFVDTESACESCHLDDDPHDDNFGRLCESCHNPVAWDLWLFDHNAQTDFPIGGAHVDVACDECHRSSLSSMQDIGEQCGDCHRSDDVHDGEFGRDCGRCHIDRSFTDVRALQ
jgi:hypothetical protein